MALDNLELTNIKIMYTQTSPNFSGRECMYNEAGKRNFLILLPYDIADEMGKLGWPVKFPKDPESNRLPFMKVSVSFKNQRFNPIIMMVTGRKKIKLNEDTVDLLDSATITKANMVLRDFEYKPGQHTAYLKELWAECEAPRFADDYAYLDDTVDDIF